MTQKTCYLRSVTLLIFNTLWFCLQTAFIIKKHMPSKIVYPVLFSMSFLLEDAFCYQQQIGHKRTKLPGQGKARDSELEVWTYMLDITYHFPATGLLERCNEWKRKNVLKNHKIHVCALLPLQTDSLDLLEEVATHTHSNLFQSK